jgi:hypothetical protein
VFLCETFCRQPWARSQWPKSSIAGGIASIATLLKPASQLAEGCPLARKLEKDARSAPAEAKKLVDEIEILSKTAEDFEQIVRDVDSQEEV